jgi:hypothetical protein
LFKKSRYAVFFGKKAHFKRSHKSSSKWGTTQKKPKKGSFTGGKSKMEGNKAIPKVFFDKKARWKAIKPYQRAF